MENKLIARIKSNVSRLQENLNSVTDLLNDGSPEGAIGSLLGEETTISEMVLMLRILRDCK